MDHRQSEPLAKFCRGEGCPRADRCRRHMEAHVATDQTYFDRSPILLYGQCGEFVANGWVGREDPLRCSGAHPPPQCNWTCQIELHRWEQSDGKWIYAR